MELNGDIPGRYSKRHDRHVDRHGRQPAAPISANGKYHSNDARQDRAAEGFLGAGVSGITRASAISIWRR
jgi:hypothetical protein